MTTVSGLGAALLLPRYEPDVRSVEPQYQDPVGGVAADHRQSARSNPAGVAAGRGTAVGGADRAQFAPFGRARHLDLCLLHIAGRRAVRFDPASAPLVPRWP